MFTVKKYLSGLAGLLFLLAFLMTGCVKDESIAPLSEDELFKSIQSYDALLGSESRSGEDADSIDDGEITDDEDDEDDTDRSTKH